MRSNKNKSKKIIQKIFIILFFVTLILPISVKAQVLALNEQSFFVSTEENVLLTIGKKLKDHVANFGSALGGSTKLVPKFGSALGDSTNLVPKFGYLLGNSTNFIPRFGSLLAGVSTTGVENTKNIMHTFGVAFYKTTDTITNFGYALGHTPNLVPKLGSALASVSDAGVAGAINSVSSVQNNKGSKLAQLDTEKQGENISTADKLNIASFTNDIKNYTESAGELFIQAPKVVLNTTLDVFGFFTNFFQDTVDNIGFAIGSRLLNFGNTDVVVNNANFESTNTEDIVKQDINTPTETPPAQVVYVNNPTTTVVKETKTVETIVTKNSFVDAILKGITTSDGLLKVKDLLANGFINFDGATIDFSNANVIGLKTSENDTVDSVGNTIVNNYYNNTNILQAGTGGGSTIGGQFYNLSVSDNGSIGGDLTVSGASTLTGNVSVSGALSVGGQLACLADGTNCSSIPTAGGWTDGGSEIYLATSGDNVTIGASGSSGKLTVSGDADEKQFVIVNNSTQNTNSFEIQNSSGAPVAWIDSTGGFGASGTSRFNSVLANANNTYDLGSFDSAWQDIYASGTIYGSLATSTWYGNVSTSTLDGVVIGGSTAAAGTFTDVVANTLTATGLFSTPNSSSTLLSVYDTLYIGRTATSTLNSNGLYFATSSIIQSAGTSTFISGLTDDTSSNSNAFVFNTNSAKSNAKLLSLQDGGSELSYFDADGGLYTPSSTISGAFTAYGTTVLGNNANSITIDSNTWDISAVGTATGLSLATSTLDNVVIGGSTAAAGTFTDVVANTLTATGLFSTPNSSSTLLSVYDTLYIGRTATSTLNSNGLYFATSSIIQSAGTSTFISGLTDDTSSNSNAFVFNTNSAKSNAKLLSLQDGGSELSYFDADGGLYTPSSTIGGNLTVGIEETRSINRITTRLASTGDTGLKIGPRIQASPQISNASALLVAPTFSANLGGVEIVDFYNIRSTSPPTINLNSMTNYYGLYVDAGNANITNSYGAYFANNVGIGITTPSSTLQLSGTRPFLEIGNGTVTSTLGGYSLTSTSTHPYGINLATNGGNVGIGTQTPSYLLDVNGSLRTSGVLFPDRGIATSTLDNVVIGGSTAAAGTFTDLTSDTLTTTGLLSTPNVSSTLLSVYDTLYIGRTATTTLNGESTSTFASGLSVNSNALTVLTSNGNVGIGTGNPTAKLTVQGHGSIYPTLSSDTFLVVGGVASAPQNTELSIIGGNSFGNPAIGLSILNLGNYNDEDDGSIEYHNGDDRMLFYTTAHTQTPLTLYGANVGIGTQSPASLLTVNGVGSFISSGATTTISSSATSTFANGLEILSQHLAIGSTATTTIRGDATSTFPYGINLATTGGNVGIGTSTPAYPLEVTGSILAAKNGENTQLILDWDNSTINNSLCFNGITCSKYIGLSASGVMNFVDASGFSFANAASFGSAVVVSGDLTINGSTTLGNSLADLNTLTGRTSSTLLSVYDTLYIGRTATATLNGESTSTFPYGINFATTGGNVGIGTSDPSHLLTIFNNATTNPLLAIGNGSATTTLAGGLSGQATSTFAGDVSIENLYSGSIEFAVDNGLTEFVNAPVSNNATTGTFQGGALLGDGIPSAIWGCLADALGSCYNRGLGVNTSTLYYGYALNVDGDIYVEGTTSSTFTGGLSILNNSLSVGGASGSGYIWAGNGSATTTITGGLSGLATSTFAGDVSIDNLYSGLIQLSADNGLKDFVNVPVSSNATTGTLQGGALLGDGIPSAIWGCIADAQGLCYNRGLGVNTSTLYYGYALNVGGSIFIDGTGTSTFRGDIEANTLYATASDTHYPSYVLDQYFDGQNDNGYIIPSLYEYELSLMTDRHLPGLTEDKNVNVLGRMVTMEARMEELAIFILELNKQVSTSTSSLGIYQNEGNIVSSNNYLENSSTFEGFITDSWSLSNTGEFIAQSVEAKVITFDELVISNEARVDEEGNTVDPVIGTDFIKSDESAKIIYNNRIKENSQIFVTFRDNTGGPWWISGQGDGWFEVKVPASMGYDIKFNYWIVGVNNGLAQNTPGDNTEIISEVLEILEVNTTNITATSVNVSWNTNIGGDSVVEFGETSNYSRSKSNDNLTTIHNLELIDLLPQTTYYYIVKSTDIDGNEVVSDEQTFITLANGVEPQIESTPEELVVPDEVVVEEPIVPEEVVVEEPIVPEVVVEDVANGSTSSTSS